MTTKKKDKDENDVKAAFLRVLEHAESHGEVYHGAIEDHKTIRAAIKDDDENRVKILGGDNKPADAP